MNTLNMPSRFKHSFESMFAGFHHYDRDATTGVRYLYRANTTFFETGRIVIHPNWDGNPDDRGSQARQGPCCAESCVHLAKDSETPQLWAPDGTKIAKTWVVHNPSLFIDTRFGIALFASRSRQNAIVFNGPDAMPYARLPIVCHVPDKKLVAERLRLVDEVTMLDRAAFKVASVRAGVQPKYYNNVDIANFFMNPCVDTYNPGVAFYVCAKSDDAIAQQVKELAFHVREYPYLLINKPNVAEGDPRRKANRLKGA